MADVVEIISGQDAAGRVLVARFSRCGDRYAHHVLLWHGDGESLLLRSDEGDARADWPPSPPLQQVTLEDRRADGRVLLLVGMVLLLVGMAGQSHWSLSVEADASATSLIFDVACRAKSAPGSLGSRYQCATPARCCADSQSAELSLPGGACRIVGDRTSDATATSISLAEQTLTVQPVAGLTAPPSTVRWKYRIESAG
jgi:hypothetical protein